MSRKLVLVCDSPIIERTNQIVVDHGSLGCGSFCGRSLSSRSLGYGSLCGRSLSGRRLGSGSLGRLSLLSGIQYILVPVVMAIAVRTEVDVVGAVLGDLVVISRVGIPLAVGGLDLQLSVSLEVNNDLVLLGLVISGVSVELIGIVDLPVVECTDQIVVDHGSLGCGSLCGRCLSCRSLGGFGRDHYFNGLTDRIFLGIGVTGDPLLDQRCVKDVYYTVPINISDLIINGITIHCSIIGITGGTGQTLLDERSIKDIDDSVAVRVAKQGSGVVSCTCSSEVHREHRYDHSQNKYKTDCSFELFHEISSNMNLT